jgi:hypothetical protein
MEIILFIIIVSLLFPGSGGGQPFELMMIPVFIICAALVLGFFAALTYAAVFVSELTGNGWLGLATWLGLLVGAGVTNKLVVEWSERRAALTQEQRP